MSESLLAALALFIQLEGGPGPMASESEFRVAGWNTTFRCRGCAGGPAEVLILGPGKFSGSADFTYNTATGTLTVK